MTLLGPELGSAGSSITTTGEQDVPLVRHPRRIDSVEVMAYYYPQWHRDPRNDARFGDGWTEWDALRRATPRFDGHRQPRTPLWGETDESDPETAARIIRTAAGYGVDGFIVDWYWYENAPFLSGFLDRGLLASPMQGDFKFALMWANHDWADLYPATTPELSTLFTASNNARDAQQAFAHVIQRYLHHPAYWRIDDRPYFSIYDIPAFVEGLGGWAPARAALDAFRASATKAGLPGLHLNAVLTPLIHDPAEAVERLGFDSATHYTWWHMLSRRATFPTTTYQTLVDVGVRSAERDQHKLAVPFLPNVTVGWDPTPRTVDYAMERDEGYPFTTVVNDASPAHYQAALETQLRAAAANGAFAVTVNAWNEWTEGSYLEPDSEHGYAYLKATRAAIKAVRTGPQLIEAV